VLEKRAIDVGMEKGASGYLFPRLWVKFIHDNQLSFLPIRNRHTVPVPLGKFTFFPKGHGAICIHRICTSKIIRCWNYWLEKEFGEQPEAEGASAFFLPMIFFPKLYEKKMDPV